MVPLPSAPSKAQDCASDRADTAHCIVDAPRALGLWHLASLDAPTVAVVWSLAFAWAGRIRLPVWLPLLLALVTWSVYVCDRLLDARTGMRTTVCHTLRERHSFHWRHRRTLLPLAIMAACAAAGIIFVFMPLVARERDSILAAAAFVYFSGVHSRSNTRPRRFRWPRSFPGKEFLVGIIFTAGCAMPAWHRPHLFAVGASVLWTFWIPAIAYAALAWLNCSCIAQWESAGASPTAMQPGRKGTFRHRHSNLPAILIACLLLSGIDLSLAAAFAPVHPRSAALLVAAGASSLLLALLNECCKRFSALALRAAADLVLLTPLLLIPFAWAFR